MKVIVLMSSYNGEEYISEQIESILNQEGSFDLELIVRDDGSSDNTISILKEYERLNKISWYSGNNIGSQNSFFNLMKNSPQSDYYAFSDQDDIWNTDKLEHGIKMLKGNDIVPCVYFSNAITVDKDRNVLDKKVYEKCPMLDFHTLSISGGILGCTMIFNNKMMEYIKSQKDSTGIVMHDYFVAVLCKAVGGKIIYDDRCNMKYRQHGSNAVGVNTTKNIFARFCKDVSKKYNCSIADQAKLIMTNHKLDKDKYNWLVKISKYRDSFINRLVLAISFKTKYKNLKSSLKNRIALLLGNR